MSMEDHINERANRWREEEEEELQIAETKKRILDQSAVLADHLIVKSTTHAEGVVLNSQETIALPLNEVAPQPKPAPAVKTAGAPAKTKAVGTKGDKKIKNHKNEVKPKVTPAVKKSTEKEGKGGEPTKVSKAVVPEVTKPVGTDAIKTTNVEKQSGKADDKTSKDAPATGEGKTSSKTTPPSTTTQSSKTGDSRGKKGQDKSPDNKSDKSDTGKDEKVAAKDKAVPQGIYLGLTYSENREKFARKCTPHALIWGNANSKHEDIHMERIIRCSDIVYHAKKNQSNMIIDGLLPIPLEDIQRVMGKNLSVWFALPTVESSDEAKATSLRETLPLTTCGHTVEECSCNVPDNGHKTIMVGSHMLYFVDLQALLECMIRRGVNTAYELIHAFPDNQGKIHEMDYSRTYKRDSSGKLLSGTVECDVEYRGTMVHSALDDLTRLSGRDYKFRLNDGNYRYLSWSMYGAGETMRWVQFKVTASPLKCLYTHDVPFSPYEEYKRFSLSGYDANGDGHMYDFYSQNGKTLVFLNGSLETKIFINSATHDNIYNKYIGKERSAVSFTSIHAMCGQLMRSSSDVREGDLADAALALALVIQNEQVSRTSTLITSLHEKCSQTWATYNDALTGIFRKKNVGWHLTGAIATEGILWIIQLVIWWGVLAYVTSVATCFDIPVQEDLGDSFLLAKYFGVEWFFYGNYMVQPTTLDCGNYLILGDWLNYPIWQHLCCHPEIAVVPFIGVTPVLFLIYEALNAPLALKTPVFWILFLFRFFSLFSNGTAALLLAIHILHNVVSAYNGNPFVCMSWPTLKFFEPNTDFELQKPTCDVDIPKTIAFNKEVKSIVLETVRKLDNVPRPVVQEKVVYGTGFADPRFKMPYVCPKQHLGADTVASLCVNKRIVLEHGYLEKGVFVPSELSAEELMCKIPGVVIAVRSPLKTSSYTMNKKYNSNLIIPMFSDPKKAVEKYHKILPDFNNLLAAMPSVAPFHNMLWFPYDSLFKPCKVHSCFNVGIAYAAKPVTHCNCIHNQIATVCHRLLPGPYGTNEEAQTAFAIDCFTHFMRFWMGALPEYNQIYVPRFVTYTEFYVCFGEYIRRFNKAKRRMLEDAYTVADNVKDIDTSNQATGKVEKTTPEIVAAGDGTVPFENFKTSRFVQGSTLPHQAATSNPSRVFMRVIADMYCGKWVQETCELTNVGGDERDGSICTWLEKCKIEYAIWYASKADADDVGAKFTEMYAILRNKPMFSFFTFVLGDDNLTVRKVSLEYFKGLALAGIFKDRKAAWRVYQRAVRDKKQYILICYEKDISAFDASQVPMMVVRECLALGCCTMSSFEKNRVVAIHGAGLVRHGVTRQGLQYTVGGQRASGDNITGPGNSDISGNLEIKYGAKTFDIMNMVDNHVEIGFKISMVVHHDGFLGSFCSGYIYPSSFGAFYCQTIISVIVKSNICIAPGLNDATRPTWNKSALYCQRNQFMRLPILRVFYSKMMDFLASVPLDENFGKRPVPTSKVTAPMDRMTLEFVCRLYDVGERDIFDCEEMIQNIVAIPCYIRHPVLDAMAEYHGMSDSTNLREYMDKRTVFTFGL